MDGKTFARFCARIEGMSVGQVRALRVRLRRLQARIEARARIDRRGETLHDRSFIRSDCCRRRDPVRMILQAATRSL